jgi:TRAP transporter TAXI family solute receptor
MASGLGVLIAGCTGDDGGDGDGSDGGSPTELTLATSVEGSTSFRIGSTFGEYLKREGYTDTFTLDAVVSPGATGGYRMMDNDEVEMSGPSTYSLEVSPDGGPFEDDPLQQFDSVRQVRGFFSVQPFVIVKQDSGIESWSDLEGKSISLGSGGAGTRVPSERMTDFNVGLDNVEVEYIGYGDQPAALRGDRIDAIFGYINNARTPSPIAPGWMQELDSSVDWTHLPYKDEAMAQFEEELPYASTFTVSAEEFFSSYTDELTAYNLTYAWTCHADLDPGVVYEVTRLSHELGEELVETDNAMGFFPDPDRFLATMHPDVPVHQGAYDYYTEAGLWEEYELTPPPEA